MQALAGFDVEYRLMQRAFHLAIFDKALAQERIGMRANVFQRVIFAINQINTDFLTVDIAAIWETTDGRFLPPVRSSPFPRSR